MSKQYAMVIDTGKCIGCQACTVACKAQNEVPDGYQRTKAPAVGPKGKFPDLVMHFQKSACMHCQDAPCVSVCPTGASHINKDGVVTVRKDICVGCKYCLTACPYQARFIHPTKGIADKCDFCYETRVKNGQASACVTTCVGGALQFGDLNDPKSGLAKLIQQKNALVARAELKTKPSVYYIRPEVK